MLVHYMFMFVLYFFHLFIVDYHGIGRNLMHVCLCLNKDRSLSCLRHPFGYVTFSFFKLPNGVNLLADSFL
jgi:hypothetical protein